jgi:cytochrome c oxidase cbb3-type subunit 3
MISWKAILKPEEMRDVSFFIMSLKGTNPPNAKAPQGPVWKDEVVPATGKSDSVQTAPPATGQAGR